MPEGKQEAGWPIRLLGRLANPRRCAAEPRIATQRRQGLVSPPVVSRWDYLADQVTHASAREVVWRCHLGHDRSAAVYQRSLSGSGCPECYRLGARARSMAGRARARGAMEEAEAAQIIRLGDRLSSGGTG